MIQIELDAAKEARFNKSLSADGTDTFAFYFGFEAGLEFAKKHGYVPPKKQCPSVMVEGDKHYLCDREAGHREVHRSQLLRHVNAFVSWAP